MTHEACLGCTTTPRNINSKFEYQVFYHCFSSSVSAFTLIVSICRVKFFLSLYIERCLMIKQTPSTARSFVNTHFYTLKLFHPPQFSFSEVIIFNRNFHPYNQIHNKVNITPLHITTYTIQSIKQELSTSTLIITINTVTIIHHNLLLINFNLGDHSPHNECNLECSHFRLHLFYCIIVSMADSKFIFIVGSNFFSCGC